MMSRSKLNSGSFSLCNPLRSFKIFPTFWSVLGASNNGSNKHLLGARHFASIIFNPPHSCVRWKGVFLCCRKKELTILSTYAKPDTLFRPLPRFSLIPHDNLQKYCYAPTLLLRKPTSSYREMSSPPKATQVVRGVMGLRFREPRSSKIYSQMTETWEGGLSMVGPKC